MCKEYLECDCGCGILRISHDTELKEFYFSIYKLDYKYSLIHKLRLIWKILKDGCPYDDQLVFNYDTANKLRSFVEMFSDNKEKK